MLRKTWFRWIKIILLIYCIIGIALYYGQEKLMFKPVAIPKDSTYRFDVPYKELNLAYNASSNINILQFQTPDTPVKGVILYFHGNAENIGHYGAVAPLLTKQGYELWMIDYPGFGKSTGDFTEAMCYEWALQFYKLARARYAPNQIVLYGRSMGSGIAAQLAAIRDCRFLILETPYYTLPSVAGSYFPVYPVEQMIRFKFPTYEYLQKVTAPVVILHGTDDGLISYSNAQKLVPYLKKGDEFVTIEGGEHNNLSTYPMFAQKMDSLLKR